MMSASERLLLEEAEGAGGRMLAWDPVSAEFVSLLFHRHTDLVVVEDWLGVVREAIARGLPPEMILHKPFPPPRRHEVILLKGARDRERGRMQLDWSAASLTSGGVLLLAGEKKGGIEGYRRFLEERFGCVESVYRRHCRVWRCSRPRGDGLPDTGPRPAYEIPGLGAIRSLPGVFAWRTLDRGTEALLGILPDRWDGKRMLDLGCGSGVLALHGASRGARVVTALDSSALALTSARATLADFFNVKVIAAEAGDELNGVYDAVLCNPPQHRGSRHALSLTRRFIETAADALRDGGELWIVLRKELPVEDLLRGCFRDSEYLHRTGYHVCRAVK